MAQTTDGTGPFCNPGCWWVDPSNVVAATGHDAYSNEGPWYAKCDW